MSFLNATFLNSYDKQKVPSRYPTRNREIFLADDVAFLAGKRCLVLDDEYLVALDIQQILEAAGAMDVTIARSATEAMGILAADSSFDFAVFDIRLGGDNSMTIAALLSERGTPFIFLTGGQADEIRAEPFAAAPVVEKPYQVPLLIEAVRRALAGK